MGKKRIELEEQQRKYDAELQEQQREKEVFGLQAQLDESKQEFASKLEASEEQKAKEVSELKAQLEASEAQRAKETAELHDKIKNLTQLLEAGGVLQTANKVIEAQVDATDEFAEQEALLASIKRKNAKTEKLNKLKAEIEAEKRKSDSLLLQEQQRELEEKKRIELEEKKRIELEEKKRIEL